MPEQHAAGSILPVPHAVWDSQEVITETTDKEITMALVGAIGHPTSKADFAKSIDEAKPKEKKVEVMPSSEIVPAEQKKTDELCEAPAAGPLELTA